MSTLKRKRHKHVWVPSKLAPEADSMYCQDCGAFSARRGEDGKRIVMNDAMVKK